MKTLKCITTALMLFAGVFISYHETQAQDKTIISPEEAKAKILAGERLAHVTIDGSLYLHSIEIKGDLVLEHVEINGYLDLTYIKIWRHLILKGTIINGTLFLRDAKVEGTVNLTKLNAHNIWVNNKEEAERVHLANPNIPIVFPGFGTKKE